LDDADLRDADLREADLRKARIAGSADLRRADLRGADLRRSTINIVYLHGSKFENAKLEEISFHGFLEEGEKLPLELSIIKRNK
jgi:uncharacterized protein YjbI with pentapeptide repeats